MKRSTRSKRLQMAKRKAKLLHRHKLRIAYAMVTVVVLVLVAYLFISNNYAGQTGRLVTFHDRGENHVILTHASSVSGALKDADITVAPQDVVEPAIGSQLLSTDSAVIIYRSRPVLVIDGALRQKIVTPAAAPNEIALAANIDPISDKDKSKITEGNIITDGASTVLTIERAVPTPVKPVFAPGPNALTISKGAQIFTDSNGVAHRETYYDLPMNIVIQSCGGGDYTIRYDGAKIDKDGYVLVAAGYRAYPKCSVVETSMGPGKVYDTGGFALRYPHGFDLATDWSRADGR
jgi:hypothetical protein